MISECKTKLSFQGMPMYKPDEMETLSQQLQSIEFLESADISDKGEYKPVKKIKELNATIADLSSRNKELLDQLTEVHGAFNEYVQLSTNITSKQDSITNLYKEILGNASMLGGLLSVSERNVIKSEVNMAKKVFNLGLRSGETKDLITILIPLLFQDTLKRLRSNHPTIVSILEQLALSPNATRNVIKMPDMKMKAAVHLLASLIDVRDQNAQNDISVLFGLLCLCFGAGPSMIGLLQRLGLSDSYPVLIKVLKSQLQHYKEIIKGRVTDDCLVVTFQDNMQLMHTSLRHLRMSKLQKEKFKQNKIWDFTVRGCRVADIEGMEDLFQNESATESQKVVKELKYDDIVTEENPSHAEKKERLQRQKHLKENGCCLLNVVNISNQQLKSMSDEDLKTQAFEPSQTETSKRYHIKIPEIPCEFPDMANKKAPIYPLPISHENQRTTLGVARNVDLFQEEFSFTSTKQERYLPLKSTGKDFDLDKAYKRFAFLKRLEQHKNQQQNYEQFLRGQEHNVSESGQIEDETEEILAVVDQESDSSDSPSD